MTQADIARIDVIAPNFKKRMSGVTSTVFRLVPIQSKSIAIASSGPNMPEDVPAVSVSSLFTMKRRGPSGARVWHARRNNEMLTGILLKTVLRKQLKLMFTSAAQRDHSGFTKWMVRKMDAVVATSQRSASYLKVPSQVIHHGIDTDRFSPITERTALREKLGLPREQILVGCYGRIRSQKGNDLFTEAMIKLLPERPDVTAVMMGGVTDAHAEFHKGLVDAVEAAGLSDRFLFLPEEKHWDISPWFQVLDLYIAPQRWEGFGLTPLEAMSCGVPVVATRVGAFEDLMREGETGFLVDIEDTAAITEATARLLDDAAMRASFSVAAREHVVQNFRIEGEAEALIKIYRSLLSAG